MKKSIILLVLTLSLQIQAAEFVNIGAVKGSITDYHKNINVLSKSYNWVTSRAPTHEDINQLVYKQAKNFIESNVKKWCQDEYSKKEGSVYYGIDNFEMSARHIDTRQGVSQEGIATFNMICASN
jgi:hypothetical protein